MREGERETLKAGTLWHFTVLVDVLSELWRIRITNLLRECKAEGGGEGVDTH